jgi:hypothetical protein
MSIPVTCPNCQTSLKAPDQAAGRMVKCPKCATAFAVPAAEMPATVVPAIRPSQASLAPAVHPAAPPPEMDDDYEPPRRSRRQFVDISTPSSTGAQFGLGIASLVVGIIGLLIAFIPCIGLFIGLPVAAIGLILGVAALIVGFVRGGQGLAFPISGSAVSLIAVIVPFIWWYVWVRPALQTASARAQQGLQQFAQKMEEEMKKAQVRNGPPGPAQPLFVGQAVNDRLTDFDPIDPRHNTPCKTYTVRLQGARIYQIDMVSAEIDSYLRLEGPLGIQMEDDDGGGNLNARITFACPADGDYRITATNVVALKPRTGSFTLTVQPQEAAQGQAVFSKQDRLTNADLPDKIRKNVPSKTYQVKMLAGKTYQIDMVSAEVDSYLRLEDNAGVQLAADDDGGGNLNSRITFVCPRDGEYRITATSATNIRPRTGSFLLTVVQR